MSREALTEASELLEEASEAVDDSSARDRLRRQAEELGDLAERDRGPDHGRLARHQQAIRDIAADVEGSVADRIEEANERINAYRETIEGV